MYCAPAVVNKNALEKVCARACDRKFSHSFNPPPLSLSLSLSLSTLRSFSQGMIYLHESVIKFHGSLTTSNCLVDSRWVVKLADFGLREFKRDAELEPADVMKKYRGKYKRQLNPLLGLNSRAYC